MGRLISSIAAMLAPVITIVPALAQTPPDLTPPKDYILARTYGEPGDKMIFIEEKTINRWKAKNGHDAADAWIFRAEPETTELNDGLRGDGIWLHVTYDCTVVYADYSGVVSVDAAGKPIAWVRDMEPPQRLIEGAPNHNNFEFACGKKTLGKTDRFWQASAAIAFARSKPTATPAAPAAPTSPAPAAKPAASAPKPYDLGPVRHMSEMIGDTYDRATLTRRGTSNIYDGVWVLDSTGAKRTDVLEVVGVIDGVLTIKRQSDNVIYTARVLPNGVLDWGRVSWTKDPGYFWALSARPR